MTQASLAAEVRDTRGRFAAGGFHGAASMSVAGGVAAPLVARQPLRTATRGERWQRIGNRIQAIPSEYTGLASREMPVGSFAHIAYREQQPLAIAPEHHAALMHSLIATVKGNREDTIAKGGERGLIDPKTERRTAHRAYNHASMLALHDFGAVDYDFRMDDHLKNEMRPLTSFIRYARRRVRNEMLARHKGAWRPYRKEFGKPFADKRTDKVTGEVRLRVRPNDVLVKAAPGGQQDAQSAPAVHPMVFHALPGILHHLVGHKQIAATAAQARAPVEVEHMLPVANRILQGYDPHRHARRRAAQRRANAAIVADPSRPLHHISR